MKILLIAAAGESTRFNEGHSDKVLKCLYQTDKQTECILYRLLGQGIRAGFDKIIIVGGYRYTDLEHAVAVYPLRECCPIETVYNPNWQSYGSMNSLYVGLLAAKQASELVFCEGDIIMDHKSFQRFCAMPQNGFAVSRNPIFAERSVVAYIGTDDRLYYLYDTKHSVLCFPAEVKAVFNSAQMWKIKNTALFFQMNDKLTLEERKGTNLILLGRYFLSFHYEELQAAILDRWINCNRREDFAEYYADKILFDL